MSAAFDRADRQYLYRPDHHLQTRGVPDDRIEDGLAEDRSRGTT